MNVARLLLISAWLLGSAPAWPSRADDVLLRAAVEERLAAMEAAVLAGDGSAYLANIDPSDAEFAREQHNWADDLARHVPERFDVSVVGEVRPGDTGEAAFDLAIAWTMPGGDARRVEFPARLARAPGGEWLYAGERWDIVPGEGVEALCAPGLQDVGRSVVRAFPAVRAHVEDGFELAVQRTQKVKLYASMQHLQASIYLSYTDGLGGWNEPGESIKLLAGHDRGPGAFRAVLAHEFGHVCTFEMGPHANRMPWWVLEGAAELAAEAFSRNAEGVDRYVRTLAATGGLGDWASMADFRETPQRQYHLVYPQGHHMLGFISEQFGRAARNRWLRTMAEGRTLDEATRDVLGLSFDELDARWRAALGAPEPEAAE